MLDLEYLSNPIEYEFLHIGINEDGIWVDGFGVPLTPDDLGALVWSAVCKVPRFADEAPSIDILRDGFWSTFMEDSVNCAIVCRIHNG